MGNIRHKKERMDAKKGKASPASKEITVPARLAR